MLAPVGGGSWAGALFCLLGKTAPVYTDGAGSAAKLCTLLTCLAVEASNGWGPQWLPKSTKCHQKVRDRSALSLLKNVV